MTVNMGKTFPDSDKELQLTWPKYPKINFSSKIKHKSP